MKPTTSTIPDITQTSLQTSAHCFFFVHRVVGDWVTIEQDILEPYLYQYGASHSERYVRDCQHVKFRNITHEIHISDTR